MKLEDHLLSLTDAQWRYLLDAVPAYYRKGLRGLPAWDSWIILRNRVNALRRAARHHERSSAEAERVAKRRAYMAAYQQRRRAAAPATS